MDLRPGERLDDLGRNGFRIIQHQARVPFATDSVLLAHFTRVYRRNRVIDLGTGSGIVPLLLAARHPETETVGVELQPDLVDMANRSVALNGVQERVKILQGDFRELASLVGREQFDVVTVNPPYFVPGTGQVSPNPARAIARHALVGTLEDAVAAAATVVRYGGRVNVVFLTERMVDLIQALRHHRLEPKRMWMVQPRAGRPPNLVLVEAVKGGGPGLRLLPNLIIYAAGQQFTAEFRAIYKE